MLNDAFRIPVKIEKAAHSISTASSVLFMGSCFAENMGRHMISARWPARVNPFGVLYNPMSIAGAFECIMENRRVAESELNWHNGLWHSFQHHGRFSNPDSAETVKSINDATLKAHQFLGKADFLIVTFGTSFVFEHKELRKVVANCHKFPGSVFDRFMLEPDEIIESWKDLIVRLRVFNPALKIIFTLSPVRHLKDGAHGNQISKAVLLLSIEKLTSLFEKVWYFPAYEIVLDELRDYRFYDAAMVQPNDVAVEYVWKRFCETQMTEEAQMYHYEVQKIIRARQHRPSGHITSAYKDFLRQSLDLINSLSMRFPSVLLEEDKKWFQDQLDKANG